MRPSTLLLASLTSTALAQNASTTPGYDNYPTAIASTLPANSNFTFGRHYALLNLDLINALVGSVAPSPAGQAFINNTATFINAAHALNPPPLQIFTRIYFANARKPEVNPNGGFATVAASTGNALVGANSTGSMVYPAFTVDAAAGDLTLQKTRYYAGAGNALEQILESQGIDTVVLSGIRTSGVILSTAYRLFDLDYKVYVIANNTIETPPDTPGINAAILEGVLPKLPANVITIEQALGALKRSGPAVY
ncbi:hypothetical protein B0A48_04984 [Cryoendolithus antarcticus]|uniref:Isochorismatase-like domain-containing protein n=1 Tax=Cryoendolithus antarcticus TaxID=1507870 RepID=A0A1V8TED8_9PEZI|nr:hypothetical protein B0A48_04984 [Cryoendolithus antarcticus]